MIFQKLTLETRKLVLFNFLVEKLSKSNLEWCVSSSTDEFKFRLWILIPEEYDFSQFKKPEVRWALVKR